MDRREIMEILASAGLRPQHQFGQNFMVDQNTLRAIADSGDIGPDDVVLEVGPGVGNLTRQLSQRAVNGAVLAVDIDRKLMPAAQRHHAALTNVHWILADVLAGKHEIEPAVLAKLRELRHSHPNGKLRLVSNLPYNAASPIIANLLVLMTQDKKNNVAAPLSFTRFAFTVQWEVAERLRADPNTKDYGPLGILVQILAEVRIVKKIPPGCFWPPPKIHSALVTVDPFPPRSDIHDVPALQRLLAGVFSHRRQKLSNGLKHYLGDAYNDALLQRLAERHIDISLRPESLLPEQFVTLANSLTI